MGPAIQRIRPGRRDCRPRISFWNPLDHRCRNPNKAMTYQRPIAEIISSRKQGDIVQTVLTLDSALSSPIAPASLYQQTAPQTKILDLHNLVEQVENRFTFETYGNDSSPLVAGSAYSFIIWWRPDQLEIAQSSSQLWHKQLFAPQDMVLIVIPGGQLGRQVIEEESVSEDGLVRGGWDHEHCFLCWENISAHETGPNDGYTNGKEWLCATCYMTYIVSGFGKKLGETSQAKQG